MQLTIKTDELQNMVSKVIECVSNNKLIPMTSLINIQCVSGELTLVTTDYTNYFYSKSSSKVECDGDCIISVLADTFVKLVQKTTSEKITLVVNGNVLTINGNGTYKLELPLDEFGKPIRFPNNLPEYVEDIGSIKLSDIKSIIAINKSAIATDMQYPVLTNYYCFDKVITSNRKMICWNPVNLLPQPILISSKLMDLLSVMSGPDITVSSSSDGVLLFKTDVDKIVSPKIEGVDDFPISSIQSLIGSQFIYSVKLPRKQILDVLERLSLFVGVYDKKSICMTFTGEGMLLSSKKSSGSELIKGEYDMAKGRQAFSCHINIEFFQNQLNSIETDMIELYYGSQLAIKIVSGDIIKVIALLNEEGNNGEKSSSQ